MTPREVALRSLVSLDKAHGCDDDPSAEDGKISNYLEPTRSAQGLSSRNRDLARELICGVLRNRSLLDWVLERSLTSGMRPLNVWEQNILRLGTYQLLFLDRIPHYAAVDESVRLSKRYGRAKTVGLTNAVLRDIIKKRWGSFHIESGDRVRDLAIRYSHPRWLVKRWIDELGPYEAESFLIADNQPAQVMASANPQKIETDELMAQLDREGFSPRPHSLVEGAVVIEKAEGLFNHGLFVKGYLHIQDAASQLVGRLLKLEPGQKVLDLCAAPGGKACWLAMHHPQAAIVAADISWRRLRKLRENQVRLGLENILILCADGLEYKSNLLFDAVILDAPCSGLGTLKRKLDLRWRIEEQDIIRLSELQKSLLESAAKWVRPQGYLLYSTCTLTREENQDRIEDFLKRHSEFRTVPVKDKLPSQVISEGAMQTWPQRHQMDGMFACLMQRSR